MAFRSILQIISNTAKIWSLNRNEGLKAITDSSRSYSKKKAKASKKETEKKKNEKVVDPCPDKTCNKKPKKKKKSLFKRMFSFSSDKKEELPPEYMCRVKQARELVCDPDLSHIEGKPYRTCGSAFIVQRDRVPEKSSKMSRENRILKKIETDLDVKHLADDPMPPYKTVELRLLELSERKLHPLYRLHNSIPKQDVKRIDAKPPKFIYKTRSGPVGANEIPKRLKFNKELLEKKNLFADFKRVEPPQAMVARLVEIEKNMRQPLKSKEDDSKKEKK